MEKPTIKFNRRKESGNIYYILASVREALMKQRRINDFNTLWAKVQGSKSYNEALEHISKVVDLVEEK